MKLRGWKGESYHEGFSHAYTQAPIFWRSHGTKADSTLTQGRVENLSPHFFFVAAFVFTKCCQDKVLSWSCDYMQIWRAFQFFLVVFDIRVEWINISSTRVLKNIPRAPHMCTNNTLARRFWKALYYSSVSQTFFKCGPLSLVRMFYGPPYSWDYHTH